MKFFLSFFLFFLFLQNVQSQNWDIDKLRKINIHRNVNYDVFFKTISNSDAAMSLATPGSLLLIGLIKKDSITIKKGIFAATAFAVNSAITIAAKKIINRKRPFVSYPEIIKLSDAGSYSMPSGHTSSAFALATSLSIAYPKWYVIAPSYLYASLVGYSRIHLGVHYPSDVLIGALVGFGSALVSQKLTNFLFNKRKSVKFSR